MSEEKQDNYHNGENVGIRNRGGQREFFDTRTGKPVEGKVYNTDEHPQGPAVRHYSPKSQFMFVRKIEIPTLSPEVQKQLDEERRITLERRAREAEEKEQRERSAKKGEENQKKGKDEKSSESGGKANEDKNLTDAQHNDGKIVINVSPQGLAASLKEAGVENPLEVAYKILAATETNEFNTPKELKVSEAILGKISPQALEKLKSPNQEAGQSTRR